MLAQPSVIKRPGVRSGQTHYWWASMSVYRQTFIHSLLYAF